MESASGYVVLSHLEEQQCERTLAEWSHLTGKKPPRDLNVHLARIRKAGYEKRASYLVKGVMNISFPVLDDRGSAIGALPCRMIQYTETDKSMDQVINSLSRAAGEIRRAIGGKFGR